MIQRYIYIYIPFKHSRKNVYVRATHAPRCLPDKSARQSRVCSACVAEDCAPKKCRAQSAGIDRTHAHACLASDAGGAEADQPGVAKLVNDFLDMVMKGEVGGMIYIYNPAYFKIAMADVEYMHAYNYSVSIPLSCQNHMRVLLYMGLLAYIL